MAQTVHTLPINDLHEHDSESDYCICKPAIECFEGGGKHIVHNSFDGRELWEEATEV